MSHVSKASYFGLGHFILSFSDGMRIDHFIFIYVVITVRFSLFCGVQKFRRGPQSSQDAFQRGFDLLLSAAADQVGRGQI